MQRIVILYNFCKIYYIFLRSFEWKRLLASWEYLLYAGDCDTAELGGSCLGNLINICWMQLHINQISK